MENENSSAYQWESYSTGFARKILEKYGYQGHGLGKNEQGRTSPILPKIRKQRLGLHSVEEIYKLEKPPSYKEYGTSTNFQQAKIQKPISEQERNDKIQIEETVIQTKDETIPKRTPEQLGEIISLRKSISEDVSQHISSVTITYAPSSQSLFNKLSTQNPFKTVITPIFQKYKAEEEVNRLRTISEILKQSIEISQNDQLSLKNFMNEVLAKDKILSSFEDEYVELELSTFMFCTYFVRIFKEISTWNFNFENLELNSEIYLELFEEWKEFFIPKLNFRTHQLWNRIVNSVFKEFKRLLWEEWKHPKDRIHFVVYLCEEWRNTISIENILSEIIPMKLRNAVNDWEPEINDISTSDWILPWIHLFESELEDVMILVYQKLLDFFKKSNWKISDSSFLSLIFSWKNVLPSFLYKKLLKEVIEPVFIQFLEDFEINPRNQDLSTFPIIIQIFQLYANEELAFTFANLLQIYFFERWYDILFTWIDDEECLLDEVIKWYQGWKELFSFNDILMKKLLFIYFHKALRILNCKINI